MTDMTARRPHTGRRTAAEAAREAGEGRAR